MWKYFVMVLKIYDIYFVLKNRIIIYKFKSYIFLRYDQIKDEQHVAPNIIQYQLDVINTEMK